MRTPNAIMIAVLLAVAPQVAQAQLGIKGGFSYGNVSNRLPRSCGAFAVGSSCRYHCCQLGFRHLPFGGGS